MGFLHCSICPPYGEIKKLWNASLVPIQWAKPHDATKMPQLLCVKLEDPKEFCIPGPEAITCCHTPGPGTARRWAEPSLSAQQPMGIERVVAVHQG